MLLDEEADRIEGVLARADRETLTRWVRVLLTDRKARSALLLGQARRVAYLRKRLNQAAAYLDGLAAKAQEEAQAAWPEKLACPHCGAPSSMVRAEARQQGHGVVHDHPDGKRCEPDTPKTVTPSRSRSGAGR